MNSEQIARELLGDELEADGRDSTAAQIRAGKTPSVVTGIALRAIARALEQPASAAGVEGMVLVPVVPTAAMLAELLRPYEKVGENFMREKYAAMLAAAPPPAKEEGRG